MKNRLLKMLMALGAVVILTACGGSNTSEDNETPVVNAGNDVSVQVNTSTTLTGTATDGGNIVSYTWTEGDTILSDSASFDYMSTAAGVHTIILTAMDDDGATTSDDVIVTVIAEEIVSNSPPVAYAGTNKTITLGKSVAIKGSGTDPDGSILSYQWKEGLTVITDSKTFTVKPTAIGNRTFTLTVTDNSGARDSDSMTVITKAKVVTSLSTDWTEAR